MTPLHQTVHAEVEHAVANQSAVVFKIEGSDNRYVQLSAQNNAIVVESVSNAYLSAGEKLTVAETALLNQLGWIQAAPDENFSRTFAQPANIEDIARLLTSTIQNVFRATQIGVERIE